MSGSGNAGGLWRSVRRLPGRTPLRVKLITALLALVAVALAVISVAGIAFLRHYLIGQTDSQLGTAADQVEHQSPIPIPNRPTYASGGIAVVWIPNGGQPRPIQDAVSGYAYFRQQHGPITVLPGPVIKTGAFWLSGDVPATVAAISGGGRWRVLAVPGMVGVTPRGLTSGTTVVAIDVTSVYQTIGRLTAIDLVVSGVLLVLLAVAGVAVVRSNLKPLVEIEHTAEAIAGGDLSLRVPVRDPRTEVGRLGRSINTMLAQIESAFDAQARSEAAARRSEGRMRQFIADASHELRTPLTAIRGFAEYFRQRGGLAESKVRDGERQLTRTELERIMHRLEQESGRMGVLVEDLLLLARLDQARQIERSPVDLLALAADAVHDARVVAPDRDITLSVDPGTVPLVLGDEVRLRQVIGNLVSNALTHTPEGTPVEVRLRPDDPVDTALLSPDNGRAQPMVVFEVADRGPGLSSEQAEHAFERFYRADPARSSGGTGLGLAIVHALVTAHDGRVWIDPRPGGGAVFSAALPLAPEAVIRPGETESSTTR